VAGYTKMVYPQTVAHRAQRRVTTLIETNALQLSHKQTNCEIIYVSARVIV